MEDTFSVKSPTSRWEWAQVTLLIANLAWTTLCLGGYRPETMLVTCVLTAVTFAVGCARGFFSTEVASSSHAPGWWLLPFLAYAALNVWLVAPAPWLGWLDGLGWANLVATFVIATGLRSGATRRILFFALVILAIVAVALGCYQRFLRPDWLVLGRTQAGQFIGRASGSFGIPNSLAAFFLLLLPVCGALTMRRNATAVARVWWGWVTTVLAFGLGLTISRGAWLGLALALAAWPLFKGKWRWLRRLKVCFAILLTCGSVAGLAVAVSPAVRERFTQLVREEGELSRPVLWRAAGKLWAENPITGTGAGSFNTMFERHRPPRFLDEPQWTHNEYLNTLSDYGLIGFALFFGAAVWIAWRALRREQAPANDGGRGLDALAIRGAFAVGLLAFGLQLFVDFHFKIPALAMAFGVCAALALSRREAVGARQPPSARPKRSPICLLAIIVVVVGMWPAVMLLRAEALRNRARQSIDRLTWEGTAGREIILARAVVDLHRATELASRHAGAWADLSFARQLEGWASPARSLEFARPAELAARRALAHSSVVPEFWLRLGVALDMQARFPEAEAAFGRALRLAPNRVQVWYYYGYHLSLDAARLPEARQALSKCLSLDPGNGAAEALLRRLNQPQ